MAAIWYLEQADISRVNNGYSVLILKYRNFRSPTSALQMTFSGDFTFSFLVQRQVPVRSIEIDWFEQARLICLEKKCFYQEICFFGIARCIGVGRSYSLFKVRK